MKTEPSAVSYARSLVEHADIGHHRNEIARLHVRLGDWFATADYLGHVVDEVGRSLEEGEWTVMEEQVASSRLSLALASVSASLPVPLAAPLGLLATLPGERLRAGISIAQLCLRSVGFDTLRVGADTSAADLALLVRNPRVSLVALFASPRMTDHAALDATYREIASACDDRGKVLILGGRGKWPDTIDCGYRCLSYQDMRDVLM